MKRLFVTLMGTVVMEEEEPNLSGFKRKQEERNLG